MIPSEPRPCSAAEAVQRALQLVGKGGQYILGTGDYRPQFLGGKLIDVPWTSTAAGELGSDCAGFAISWCYKLKRHRPGFNRGPWATVADDLNCNSALEDAQHQRDLFMLTDTPAPGVLLVYPTITLLAGDGTHHTFIGHVGIVTSCRRVSQWDVANPHFEQLDVAQCRGPNGRTPAVVATDGSVWSHHNAVWPKSEHRAYMLQPIP